MVVIVVNFCVIGIVLTGVDIDRAALRVDEVVIMPGEDGVDTYKATLKRKLCEFYSIISEDFKWEDFPCTADAASIYVPITENRGHPLVNFNVHKLLSQRLVDQNSVSDPEYNAELENVLKGNGEFTVPVKFTFHRQKGVDIQAGEYICEGKGLLEAFGVVVKQTQFNSCTHPRGAGYAYGLRRKGDFSGRKSDGLVLDSLTWGNDARFFNTVQTYAAANVRAFTMRVKLPTGLEEDKLIFYTTRDVLKGESLLVCYGQNYVDDGPGWEA
jgi:hypothetical protein